MRVIRVARFGGPDVLVPAEAPDPTAEPGTVVVQVSVADVGFIDTQIRSGWAGDYFKLEPPYVPGGGVAGRVVDVGPGVDPRWAGRRVVAHTGATNGYAELASAPAAALIPVPEGLDLREAAALLHDGPTAVGLAGSAPIRARKWVLVLAAGGGLGILLVQLAHSAGARVIGAARGRRKLDMARDMGADATFDYSEPGWPERVRAAAGGNGPEVVFDGAGGEVGRAAFEITARGGWFSAHGAPSGAFAPIEPLQAQRKQVTLRGIQHVQFTPADLTRLTERALTEAAAGRLQPVIGQEFPLERAAEAHSAIESRSVIGRTLLLV